MSTSEWQSSERSGFKDRIPVGMLLDPAIMTCVGDIMSSSIQKKMSWTWSKSAAGCSSKSAGALFGQLRAHSLPTGFAVSEMAESATPTPQPQRASEWPPRPAFDACYKKRAEKQGGLRSRRTSHANLAAAGSSAAGTRGFLAVIFSYMQNVVLPTKLYCFLHIQKDDGQETK